MGYFLRTLMCLTAVIAAVASGISCKTRSNSDILMDLYYNTDGPSWNFNTGWGIEKSVCDWFGVACSGTEVVGLDLHENNLVGKLTSSLSCLKNLSVLRLYNNKLTGTLLHDWSELKHLSSIDLSFNLLNGSLPSTWHEMSRLLSMDLSTNSLIGNLPDTWGKFHGLQSLHLTKNKLNGTLPSSWGTMQALSSLLLYSNELTGPIPDSFAALKNLNSFDVSLNKMTGTPYICSFPFCDTMSQITERDCQIYGNNFSGRLNITCFGPSACTDSEFLSLILNGNGFCSICALPRCTHLCDEKSGTINAPSLTIKEVDSKDECCDACARYIGCAAAVYTERYGHSFCSLKNVTGPVVSKERFKTLLIHSAGPRAT